MAVEKSVARFRPPAVVPFAERALWLQDAAAGEEVDRPLEQVPGRADVCIVGGGFAGLWTAIHLKQRDPSIDVTIVEAGVCGSGASGRNGGFVMTSWSKFGTLKKLCGVDDALHYARGVEQAVSDIGAFCEANDIDAHFRQGGWLWAATNRSQIDAWQFTIDELAKAGEAPYRILDPEEVARRSGSAVHVAGVFEDAPATVHPGLLARGLAGVARRLGVTIVEYAPMTELQVGPSPLVTTTRGSIRADRVVLTMAAWATALPTVRRSVVVIASDVVATEPIPERLKHLGFPQGLSISDSRRLVNYYRTTEDGRVVFGKGGGGLALGSRITAGLDRSPQLAQKVRRQFDRIYPTLADVPTARHWRGPVDYSSTGVPFIGPLNGDPRVLMAAGFSGNGVGPSYVAGTALADMVFGQEPERVPEGLRAPRSGGMPPEPVRYLGGRVVRAAVQRKEASEDQGRSPGRVITALAGLDPTSFTDRGTST